MTTDVTPKPRLRWYQFSLRSLLVFVTLFALPCSWVAVKREEGHRQRVAVEALRNLGGGVEYDWQFDADGNLPPNRQIPGPAWLRSVLGNEFFQQVVVAYLRSGKTTDEDFERLKEFRQLKEVRLNYPQAVGLSWSYPHNQVTDAGLSHLKGLSQLQGLDLLNTQVTDAGLEYLKGLNRLKWLDLEGTQVTDEGVGRLQQALPNCEISF